MWGYLFGSQAKKGEAPKRAIVDLREHIATLNKKQTYLEKQVEEQRNTAKRYVAAGKTALAKAALKKKAKYEADLEKIANQVESLEVQLGAIESANLNMETMKAMKQGANVMKQIHKEFDIDKVDETMDQIREQVEASEEISEAISRPLGNDYVDEDELDEELAELQEELVESNLVDTHKEAQRQTGSAAVEAPAAAAPQPARKLAMPDAPNTQLESEDEDERALRELQAEMGM